ncbi:MAG: hypothetical protein M3209_10505 [Acidobacteriota bacterium]|nr:hypothetical protein [Acidobacteriota bacterium]
MKIKATLRFAAFFILFTIFSWSLCFGQTSSETTSDTLQNELNKLLRANAYPVRIQNGNLSGEGARWLSSELQDVQFIAFGEVHNRRSVHKFGGALFRMLHDEHGFNYLALEEDPYLGKLSSQAANRGGSEAMIKLSLRYPNAFHLLTEEELEMIGDIGKLSKAKIDPIWGLNQVFGATHIYERLLQIAPDANARTVVQKLLNTALEYEKERFQKNISYMGAIAQPADFEELKKAFKARLGSEADWLIEQLALSNSIYRNYNIKPRPAPIVFHEGNQKRENNMKRLFAERYRKAQAAGDKLPKVMAMFGHLHLYRGLSEQTDLFTLGNYLSELAIFNGKKSFGIYSAVDLPSFRQTWQGEIIQAIENAGEKTDDGVIVDLRPLKTLAITRNPESAKLNPSLRRLIFGFDVFLFLRDGVSGSREKLKTPNFRMYPDEN